jgi:glycosyltransferase involved in cell wall biosynthesis
MGGADSVRSAAADADVLLSWGVSLDEYLGDVRPPLSVQVLHGDGPYNRLLLNGSRRSIDHLITVSHSVHSRIAPDVPASVIYNGIDTARLARRQPEGALRRRLGLQPDDFIVGYVGRFATEKRVSVILEAVARLPERFKSVLVGWGPLLGSLREQAERDLPGRCTIASVRDELGDVYRMMDAVCLMSDQEGFPLVMLEAMHCGRPFVATPVGGVAEIIEDRVNGLITDGSPEHLASRLQLLADNPRWAAGIAAQGAACVEQFGYAHRMARDYEHLLHHLWNLRQAA